MTLPLTAGAGEVITPAPVMSDQGFKHELILQVPSLRAFAISLVGKIDRADDLVQETLMKAWANRAKFTPGTNIRAWLFTILRNEFYTVFRKRRREVEDADGAIAASVGVHPEQEGHMDLADMKVALARLPVDQREALLLVSASDMSYEEAAAVCGVAVGTIKSRVNRARAKLCEILGVGQAGEFGPDAAARAVMTNHSQS
jgi:RNA polymerase sigma-70 factor (ECF subfamily)